MTIFNKLEALNSSASSGILITNNNTYNINLDIALDSIEKFENLIIAKHQGKIIYLRQVAKIYLGSTSIANSSMSMVDGKPGVVDSVSQTSDANPIKIAEKVTKSIQAMQKSPPPGMHAEVIFNISNALKTALNEIAKKLLKPLFWSPLFAYYF